MLTLARRPLAVFLLTAASIAACTSNDVAGPGPAPDEGTFTVDASTAWRYVSLADSALVIPTPSAHESAAWDIAFNGTNVTLNGGVAGPGDVSGACICQNAAATDDAVLAMTPASELPAFDAVTSVPGGTVWWSDVLTPAIAGWFTGIGAAAVADSTKNWLVRLSDSSSYAVVRVQSLSGATATSPGTVTLEWALQSSDVAVLGVPQTLTVDLTTPGAKSVDLNTGTLTGSSTDWDLRLEGFTIRVNGGISGAGKGGAAVSATPFDDVTTAVTGATAYRTDSYAGIFGAAKYYRYNILGDHRISPTFDVYLVRRGSTTYKLQIIGYYGPTGTARQITFRWQRLD